MKQTVLRMTHQKVAPGVIPMVSWVRFYPPPERAASRLPRSSLHGTCCLREVEGLWNTPAVRLGFLSSKGSSRLVTSYVHLEVGSIHPTGLSVGDVSIWVKRLEWDEQQHACTMYQPEVVFDIVKTMWCLQTFSAILSEINNNMFSPRIQIYLCEDWKAMS